ncbi:MAG: imidazole glycerol phosphate synthase subunit HisH [Myxococcota bacterium]|nr:imidazole glycerol phosphate synthase subunit HisH [Myxococcota bacterium]MDW8360868.1 imidazole glycerol phosphate synthase subunit HisH [Myxococcales bacterium]
MTDVCVVDLGLGNVASVLRAVGRAGGRARLTAEPDAIARATHLLVPGQGEFGRAARALHSGIGEAIVEALARGGRYFGICLGMQLLFERSEESPGARGLALMRGHVRRLPRDARDPVRGERLKVPHVGWNEVVGRHPWLPARCWYYFVHSYVCVPDDDAVVAGTTEHGVSFPAAVSQGPVFAVQFHPEKSQQAGEDLLARWIAGEAPRSG